MKVTSLALLCLLSLRLFGQDPVAQKYGATITPEELKGNLSILASDAMEGRETGKRGQKMAAAFISAHFEEIGLMGPLSGRYLQPIDLFTTAPGESYIKIGAIEYKNFQDIAYSGNANSGGEL